VGNIDAFNHGVVLSSLKASKSLQYLGQLGEKKQLMGEASSISAQFLRARGNFAGRRAVSLAFDDTLREQPAVACF
jgi:hypothetical protein